MNTKTAVLTFILLLLMAGGVVLGVYLVRQNQDARSRADNTVVNASNDPTLNQSLDQSLAQQQNNAQGAQCTPPNEVSNVSVNYPDCD